MSTTTVPTQTLLTVCKLRWVPKQPTEQMTINNLEALRLMATGILLEQQEKWDEAKAAKAEAKMILDDELREYLSGLQHTIALQPNYFGFNDFGDPL